MLSLAAREATVVHIIRGSNAPTEMIALVLRFISETFLFKDIRMTS